MKHLTGLSVFYVKIIISIISKVDALKAWQLSSYWLPEGGLLDEEYQGHWEMIAAAADEVGFDEVERLLQKIDRIYAKKTKRKVLRDQQIYEIVTAILESSPSDTKLFNAFIQAIIKK